MRHSGWLSAVVARLQLTTEFVGFIADRRRVRTQLNLQATLLLACYICRRKLQR